MGRIILLKALYLVPWSRVALNIFVFFFFNLGAGTLTDLKKKNYHLFFCTLVEGVGRVGVKLGTVYFLPLHLRLGGGNP